MLLRSWLTSLTIWSHPIVKAVLIRTFASDIVTMVLTIAGFTTRHTKIKIWAYCKMYRAAYTVDVDNISTSSANIFVAFTFAMNRVVHSAIVEAHSRNEAGNTYQQYANLTFFTLVGKLDLVHKQYFIYQKSYWFRLWQTASILPW